VGANVRYPTDSGLLVSLVCLITALVGFIHAVGLAPRTAVRDRRRAAKRRAHEISMHLKQRNDEAKTQVLRVTGELATIAEKSLKEAMYVAANAKRGTRRVARRAGAKALRAMKDLETMIERGQKVIDQTRERLSGSMPDSSTRIVSLHDPDARPIKKGRLSKPLEFGYKGQVVDNEDGVILDHSLHTGAVPDAGLLVPAIKRITALFGIAPRAVAADRGYGQPKVDTELAELDVKTRAIPRRGKTSTERRGIEHSRGFRKLVKWRTGSEGRISYMKRGYGWDRTMLDGITGATTWCGFGVLAHNLGKIATLIEEKEHRREARAQLRRPTGAGPPPRSSPEPNAA